MGESCFNKQDPTERLRRGGQSANRWVKKHASRTCAHVAKPNYALCAFLKKRNAFNFYSILHKTFLFGFVGIRCRKVSKEKVAAFKVQTKLQIAAHLVLSKSLFTTAVNTFAIFTTSVNFGLSEHVK